MTTITLKQASALLILAEQQSIQLSSGVYLQDGEVIADNGHRLRILSADELQEFFEEKGIDSFLEIIENL